MAPLGFHRALLRLGIPAHHYGIGVDTAEGLADGDNSVISVVCKETGRQVAELAGKISAIKEHELARMYGTISA